MQKRPLSAHKGLDQQPTQTHSLIWWVIKVICGMLLITNAFLVVLYDLEVLFARPRLFAQGMVIFGGACSIYHYVKLKAKNIDIQAPMVLENNAGLYRLVRHPMYLSDIIIYSGLALLYPTFFSILLLVISVIALGNQAKVEDYYLAIRFPDSYADWEKHSYRLIPYLY